MAPPNWPTVGVGDGWVGDTSHQARPSDHNPDWDSGGVVRAVDIGIQGRDANAILREVVGDKRVWYVIHKGIIRSRTYGWAARRYTGSNPHNHHIHVSIRSGRSYENDKSAWFGPKRRTRNGPVVDVSKLRDDFENGRESVRVRRIQRGLNRKLRGRNLKIDGVPGDNTKDRWKDWEEKHGLKRPNRIPQMASVRPLGRGRWAVKR